jgi:hypothetical protein
LLQEVLLDAEVKGKADGPADQSAHDVTLLFVAWYHPIDS